jgi:hypothetical protein
MKLQRLAFFLTVIVASVFCKAQSSFPTLNDNPKWRIEAEPSIYPHGLRYFNDYYIEKDTTINTISYSAIIINSANEPVNPYSYRVGYIRSDEKKVFYKQTADREEFLLYDFGLIAGDTCHAYYDLNESVLHTVLSVDTIMVNGIERKRLLVESDFGWPSYWVEGVGAIRNPIEPYRSCVRENLRCLTINGETVYLNPNRQNCDSLFDITSSIVNTSMRWLGMKIKFDETEVDSLRSYYIKFSGDTVGNYDIPCVKVWQSFDSLASDWNLIGTIREESKKTWFKPLDKIQEHLIYDFSLTMGESVGITKPDGFSHSMKVTDIDSLEIFGIKRLGIQLVDKYNSAFTETWIEKIGSLRGIISSCDDAPGWENKILCVKENETQIYSNEAFPDCFYSIGGETNLLPINEEHAFSIYPNPATNQIFITNQFKQVAKLNVKIFDAKGNVIHNQQHVEHINGIDVSGIPGGIYFIQITIEEKITTRKIMIR